MLRRLIAPRQLLLCRNLGSLRLSQPQLSGFHPSATRFYSEQRVQINEKEALEILEKNDSSMTRNIAIIAHVDHGKTSLVDCLLKQTGIVFDSE